jgi:Pyruvate/2-oxoacid:ferredoxin oxidoreductase gamma subunit
LIVANNFNYGMTGGQHSCTTPLEAVTATTPHGNLEAPLDLVRTLQPSKPSFLGRTHVFAEGQVDVLVEAIRTPGFALVDIWDFCIAYVGGRMALNKQAIESLMEKLDMPAGILYRGDRPEYSEAWRALYEEAGRRTAPQELQVVGGSALDHKVGIILAGGAGQKIRSAATLIGTAAIMSGLKATQKDDYPITVRTGHSVSEVIVSPNDIHYSGIEDPDIVIVLAKDGLAQVARKLRKCSPAARVYVDEALAGSVETPGQVIALPLAQTAKRVGKLAIAPIAFGAVLAREGLFPANILEAAARATQKEAVAESNIAGLQAGLEL